MYSWDWVIRKAHSLILLYNIYDYVFWGGLNRVIPLSIVLHMRSMPQIGVWVIVIQEWMFEIVGTLPPSLYLYIYIYNRSKIFAAWPALWRDLVLLLIVRTTQSASPGSYICTTGRNPLDPCINHSHIVYSPGTTIRPTQDSVYDPGSLAAHKSATSVLHIWDGGTSLISVS